MSRLYKSFQKYHKWFALIFTLFFILFALSGIVLNHRSLISGVDVNRKWLPNSYALKNWNLASVKGDVKVGEDSILFYGGAGVWLTDSALSKWTPFMNGFPKGSDQRKIFDLIQTPNGDYFAATRFGLYRYSTIQQSWSKQQFFSEDDEFITGLEVVKDKLYVLTRNHLYTSSLDNANLSFTKVELIVPEGSKPKITIFRLFWIIHSGEILGISGRLVVDLMGLIMLFLSITGLIYFLFPKIIKRVKDKIRLSRLKRTTRFSYNWHIKIGIYTSILLVIVSFTGIFLRPPFLLLVVNGVITQRSNPNNINEIFWSDKLRDIKYDEQRDIFLLATSDGIYYSRNGFTSALKKFPVEPPVSIMGINVLEILDNGDYLVGSFSGAYRWNPYTGLVAEYFSGQPIHVNSGFSSPFGSFAIAGFSNNSGKEYFFDYDKGIFSTQPNIHVFEMPQIVKDSFPFPLWNLAQEVHTCRIYSPIIGLFYILIVPLAGIAMLVLIITGVWMWYKKSGVGSRKSEVGSQKSEVGS
ncbi:MAG: PepSY domain-containing protein [Bacteroidales bacterium]|nr:MAG: PepSY domain-containing protein [Bacteroidales bacterium]